MTRLPKSEVSPSTPPQPYEEVVEIEQHELLPGVAKQLIRGKLYDMYGDGDPNHKILLTEVL